MAKSSTERMRSLRARRREQIIQAQDSNVVHETMDAVSMLNTPCRDSDNVLRLTYNRATEKFIELFDGNEFGHSCPVCDRLWFRNDLRSLKQEHIALLASNGVHVSEGSRVCSGCRMSLDRHKMPTLSTINGFVYPPKPVGLPELDPISTRLVSPRLPFMAIRRLRRDGDFAILGQVINIPVDVNEMCLKLPRSLDNDYAINISIKRKLIHPTSYLQGHVRKRVVKKWLEYLINQPLYQLYNIEIDQQWLAHEGSGGVAESIPLEEINDVGFDALVARQNTLLWSEECILTIAPGERSIPLSFIFDKHAEELSFPSIYYGVPREFRTVSKITPYMIANSEIRRSDRRGATPEHVLYMAMKILRLRVVDGITRTFRDSAATKNVTARMLRDKEFLDECAAKNLAFLRSIPNSAQYWMHRRRDLFAMMRQLGKPTCFLTMSTNELNNINLLKLLSKLQKRLNSPINIDILPRHEKAQMVSEDPVTCALYFYKMTGVILNMLQSSKDYNPFGPYRVIDYFIRYEFQHRGSPHAHILLWLANDSKEEVSESMSATIKMAEYLSSVSEKDLEGCAYENQVHNHTFTCTKRGESQCRFNIPYWPIRETRVLLPLAKDDGRLRKFSAEAKKLKQALEIRNFEDIEHFLSDNEMSYEHYLNVIRSALKRPTLLFRRDMKQLRTNTFHPWIAKTLNSNMDIQIILEEYSCATYVVDYVNKSNRGCGNLHRELVNLRRESPEADNLKLMKKLGNKLLNTVELSAQEAAWYLLRQPMSEGSRKCIFLPTCWPCERQKSVRRNSELKVLNPESIDIWTKSIIQKYEQRPKSLELCCLADYAAKYNKSTVKDTDPLHDQSIDCFDTETSLHKRTKDKIIRYCNYDPSDPTNYKREMVTLFVPFRNEHVEILDQQRFFKLYEDNIQAISTMKRYYDRCDFEKIMNRFLEEKKASRAEPHFPLESVTSLERLDSHHETTVDAAPSIVSSVHKRTNILPKEEYCSLMRSTNYEQREILLEIIHRLHESMKNPLQIFFTGPAGSGKTFVMRLAMETYNRYTQESNHFNNAYIACASTGKAAVNLGGLTVHSAFHLSHSSDQTISQERIQILSSAFKGVKCIMIDEVSMLSNQIFHGVNKRLQQITGEIDQTFGGLDMIIGGDFHQLAPVCASSVFEGSRNHIEGSLLWQTLSYFPLRQVVRQKNASFSSILTKVGRGENLTNQEAKCIEDRFRTEQWCDANLEGVMRIYHTNEEVHAYNKKILTKGKEYVSMNLFSGYSSAESYRQARNKLHRLTTQETGNLPYMIVLEVGQPYMITTNIDVDDGLVNGSVGILRHIEECSEDPQHGINNICVWIEFTQEKVGRRARDNHKTGSEQINSIWTPVVAKSVNIPLGGSIKCKRTQLPLVPACAITIHKSQGGTYDRVILRYSGSMQNQLVYVGLSRVTDLEGLFLVNSKNDFTFYHKTGRAQAVRNVRDEYRRLENHPLDTITSRVKCFVEESTHDVLLCAINSQSLKAHSSDIESDEMIPRADILAFSETWVDSDNYPEIRDFELVVGSHCRTGRAGGAAIYRRRSSNCSLEPMKFKIPQRPEKPGDCAAAFVHINSGLEFVLSVFYIKPGTSKSNLSAYIIETIRELESQHENIIITGDFNYEVQKHQWLGELMREKFRLEYVDIPSATTLGSTNIDLSFCRNLIISIFPYVAYFSYHRPLFIKISRSSAR